MKSLCRFIFKKYFCRLRSTSLAGTRIARLRPGLEMVQKTDMYAGLAFAVSPEPSSLPLPSFSRKKQVLKVVDDDSATRDLRWLLRLD
ncbi:unnamed protein product [Malus baccata var. baccata]